MSSRVNEFLYFSLTLRFYTWKDGDKEMFIFNNAHNTFYVQFCGVGSMVKDHSDSEREKPSTATSWATLSD